MKPAKNKVLGADYMTTQVGTPTKPRGMSAAQKIGLVIMGITIWLTVKG